MGTSCAADSDCGGPTSEWPHCNNDGETTAGEDPQDNGSESNGDDDTSPSKPQTPGSGTKRDAGTGSSAAKDAGKGVSLDAGVPTGTTPPTAFPGTDGESNGADAGVPDASVKPIDDAGMHTVDGGLDGGVPRDASATHDADAPRDAATGSQGSTCTTDSDGRDAGGCFGIFCSATPEQLASNLSAQGACLEGSDLALVCDGELARVVDQCAQDSALALGFGSTVRACARAANSLEEASPGCIDCYVDERLCAVENCLAACLSGRSMDCTECRATRCGAAFATCSGLPRPSAR